MVAIDVAHSESKLFEVTSQYAAPRLPPWRVVWCHERSHKSECDERRTAITEAASKVGASLVCLKKAGKFASWLTSVSHQPYVLLTDWREVKPCLQTLGQEGNLGRPAIIVVLAELPQHFDRASTWTKSLDASAEPVFVLRELGSANAFMKKLLTQLQDLAVLPKGQCTDVKDETVKNASCEVPERVAAAPTTQQTLESRSELRTSRQVMSSLVQPPGSFLPYNQCLDFAFEYPLQPFHQIFDNYDPAPVLATIPMKPLSKKLAYCDSGAVLDSSLEICSYHDDESGVAGIISPVCASRNFDEIEQLLREAMPDHYDE